MALAMIKNQSKLTLDAYLWRGRERKQILRIHCDQQPWVDKYHTVDVTNLGSPHRQTIPVLEPKSCAGIIILDSADSIIAGEYVWMRIAASIAICEDSKCDIDVGLFKAVIVEASTRRFEERHQSRRAFQIDQYFWEDNAIDASGTYCDTQLTFESAEGPIFPPRDMPPGNLDWVVRFEEELHQGGGAATLCMYADWCMENNWDARADELKELLRVIRKTPASGYASACSNFPALRR